MLPFLHLTCAAAPIEVNVHRNNHHGASMFDIHAKGFVRATPDQAWRVLTDYESLPRFVPDLVHSRIVSRSGQEIMVEQESRAGFLFVSQTIHLVVRINEHPTSRIDVALISGGMKQYDAHWELVPATEGTTSGTQIRYSGTMAPAFYVPPLIGNMIVQANVSKTVNAVIAEIERRVAANAQPAN
jgi:ribosome-associated toxin RatA of RatAB toxin-antitoxin module